MKDAVKEKNTKRRRERSERKIKNFWTSPQQVSFALFSFEPPLLKGSYLYPSHSSIYPDSLSDTITIDTHAHIHRKREGAESERKKERKKQKPRRMRQFSYHYVTLTIR